MKVNVNMELYRGQQKPEHVHVMIATVDTDVSKNVPVMVFVNMTVMEMEPVIVQIYQVIALRGIPY